MADKKKIRYGGTSLIDRMNKAMETESVPLVPNTGTMAIPPVIPTPSIPPSKIFKPGVMYPISDIMEKQSSLRKRSVAGSAPFTEAEIKKGYRKL